MSVGPQAAGPRSSDVLSLTVVIVNVVLMTIEHSEFTLHRPAALIGALPSILGFVPENSLILVTLEGTELGSVLRVDLLDDLVDNIEPLAAVAASAAPRAVVAVIVDGIGACCPACDDRNRRILSVLNEELSCREIVLASAYIVDRVARGGRWRCADGCGSAGLVDDPDSSPLTAAAVLEGRRLYGRREDLQAAIAPDDETRSAAVAALIGDAAAGRAAGGGVARHQIRRELAQVLAVVTELAAGGEPTESELAQIGCLLSDMLIRDTLCALAISVRSIEAERLWSLLARTLPLPWRAEALVLLAFSAYARGDGPLAGVSLEAALRGVPRHRMAGLLDTALQSGLRPDRIRGLADSGYRLAHQIGVALPQRRRFRQRAG